MKLKKLLSFALALAMVLAFIPAMSLTASAAYTENIIRIDGVKYSIVSDNLITNPDSLDTYTNALNGGALTTWEAVTSTTYTESGWAMHNTSTAGGSATNTMRTFFPITGGKTYYVTNTYYNNTDAAQTYGAMAAIVATGDPVYGTFAGLTIYSHVNYGGYNSWSNESNVTYVGDKTSRSDIQAAVGYNKIETIINAPDDAKNIMISYGAYGNSEYYFGDFAIYEVEEVPKTSATITFVNADNGDTLDEITVDDLYVGDSYTYPTAYYESADYTKYYSIASETITELSETASDNTLALQCSEISFAEVKDLPSIDDNVIVDGAVYKVTDATNKITNPSFETADGDFSIYGWHSAETDGVYADGGTQTYGFKLNGAKYYFLNEEITESNGTELEETIPDGSWAFGSRWNDGVDGLCSIRDNFYVGAGTYYLSFYVKANTDSDATIQVGATSSLTAGNVGSSASLSLSVDNTGYADWTKVETVVTTTEDNPYIQFTAYSLGNDNNAGSLPYYYFDDFVLVAVEEDPDASVTVTVKYSTDGTEDGVIDDLTYTTSAVKGYSIETTAISSYLYDGKYYDAESETVEVAKDATADITKIVTLEVDTSKYAPTSDFSYHFGTQDVIWAGDNGYANTQNATIAIGWDGGTAGLRETIMTFDIGAAAATDVLSTANLNVYCGYTNNTSAYINVYAIDPSYVDVDTPTMLTTETWYYADLDTALSAMGGTWVGGASGSKGNYYSISLDFSGVDVSNGEIALFIACPSQNQYYIESTNSSNPPYLSNITYTTKDVGVTVFNGAQIRIGGGVDESGEELADTLAKSGLRFIATVDRNNTLASDGVADEIGIAISADDTFDATDKLVSADQYQDGEDQTIFTVAITGIAETNYNTIYYAIPYVRVGTEYYTGTAVARTPYQVAAGILTSDSRTDSEGYSPSTSNTDALYAVLNVYANKTGARLTLDTTNGYAFGKATYANGAEAFFEVEQADLTNESGDVIGQTITLTANGDATFYSYWDDTLRIENNHSVAITHIDVDNAVRNGNTLTFNYYYDANDIQSAE